MTDDNRFSVVVVGGGLAGLVAALHLAERGIMPLVLEADNDWAGGRLAGGEPDIVTHNGRTWTFPTEHGMHGVWGGYVNMRAMLANFLNVELVPSQGEEWINRWRNQVRYVEAGSVVRGKWIPAPFHYLQLLLRPRFWNTITLLDALSLPGLLVSLFLTLGFDPIAEQKPLHGLKLKDYFILWTPNLRVTFEGIGANMLASNKEAINLTAFIVALRFYTLLRRDLWHIDYFPTDSHSALIQPLIQAIEARGGKVLYGARARQLIHQENSWLVRFEEARLGTMRTLETDHVILAVNPPAAQKLLANSPSTPIDDIRFPEVTRNSTVRLWFNREPRKGAPSGMFTGDFAMDNFFWLHRIHAEFKAWHEATGGSCIEVHIYNRDKLIDQSDQVIQVLVANEVQMAFPELRGHLIHVAYRSNGYTQTQFEIPTAKSLHVATPWVNISACGDWIGYPTPSLWMERCTVTAIAAANRVLATYELAPFDLIPQPRPELLARAIGAVMRGLRRVFAPVLVPIFRRL